MTNSDSNACCHTFAPVASIFDAIVRFAIFSADIHGPMLISCFPDTFESLHQPSKLIKLWGGAGSTLDRNYSCSCCRCCSSSACTPGQHHFGSSYSSFYFNQFISIISNMSFQQSMLMLFMKPLHCLL